MIAAVLIYAFINYATEKMPDDGLVQQFPFSTLSAVMHFKRLSNTHCEMWIHEVVDKNAFD